MFEIVSDIAIEAPPTRVWSALMDFRAFPDWNPFVRRIEGAPRVGERLRVTIQPPGGRQMTFRPMVLHPTTLWELRWLGRVLLPGVFDGEHYFQVQEVGGGRSRLIHGERFTGLMVPFLRKGLDTATRAGFLAMNRALKIRVERGH
jgi:hypothetical protein